MPRKIITLDVCDVCLNSQDKETPAVWTALISIDKLTREFMLCDRHRKEIIGDLPAILEQCGTRPVVHPAKPKAAKSKTPAPSATLVPTKAATKTHKSKANPLACDAPDCVFVAHNGTGLSAHRRAKHPELEMAS